MWNEWGPDLMIAVTTRDMSELSHELRNVREGNWPGKDLFEKIAKVQVMIGLLRWAYDPGHSFVGASFKQTTDRIEYRLAHGRWPEDGGAEGPE